MPKAFFCVLGVNSWCALWLSFHAKMRKGRAKVRKVGFGLMLNIE